MTVPLWQVDSFTEQRFRGNPAAVCLLSEPAPAEWMQAVAAEMNLSETAFVSPGPNGTYQLRWFTPTVEVDLCGHATLAAAWVLRETGAIGPGETIHFQSRSGILRATATADNRVQLDFPATPAAEGGEEHRGMLAAALHTEAFATVGRNVDLLVAMEDPESLVALAPDMTRIAEIPVRGVIVTTPPPAGRTDADFWSRFFGPRAGVPEDPVTGSAHCTLGPYWATRLKRTRLTGYQASRRGGYVGVEVRGERVRLSGAVTPVFHTRIASAGR